MSQTYERPAAIVKELSANDTGDTGGHQAGILVPKQPRILRFFPTLDRSEKNPRQHLIFHDDAGGRWEFAFIYYNNAFFGGTRNEFRLTRMTPYMQQNGLKPGDQLILRRDADRATLHVGFRRASRLEWTSSGALKLGGTWKEIKF